MSVGNGCFSKSVTSLVAGQAIDNAMPGMFCGWECVEPFSATRIALKHCSSRCLAVGPGLTGLTFAFGIGGLAIRGVLGQQQLAQGFEIAPHESWDWSLIRAVTMPSGWKLSQKLTNFVLGEHLVGFKRLAHVR